ncbi:GntR family transcriptional regulator [Streptomyces sp. SP17BM10]|uniref:GntR family transcriptional regulator n=1 Tax=Streptomyces sp. SP17BM10 TaxID=3002530 RepID=UPI002E793C70|nr:GntR family transcriptional regulator [Streptomyces sp. SP17BM10]MEE1784175.1 GntR family transcriptional regulator [Streptomyces sp. SP17BM10]
MPEIERPAPAYQQVVSHLREQIDSGALAPGDALPSATEIAREWKVSRPTAQRAVATLAAEGLVETRPGQVARVKGSPKPLHRSGMDRAVATRKTGRIYGDTGEYARIVSAEVVPAPADVAEVLGIEVGAPAISRLRVTYSRDDKPLSASTSWYDGAFAEVAPLLLVPERIPEGSWGYLERVTGHQAVVGRDAIDVRLATQADALALGLTLPAAVKEASTILRTGDQVVVEYGVSVSGPGRVSVYDYEL